MAFQKKVTISGICPYLKKQHSITARLEEITFMGDTNTYFKCVDFSCDFFHECTFVDECPLHENAKNIQPN